jgi:hypothetical protein
VAVGGSGGGLEDEADWIAWVKGKLPCLKEEVDAFAFCETSNKKEAGLGAWSWVLSGMEAVWIDAMGDEVKPLFGDSRFQEVLHHILRMNPDLIGSVRGSGRAGENAGET